MSAPENLVAKIHRLRQEREAIILAHNYVSGEVQDIADFVGDSLELSIKAKASAAPVIVFCGVAFMAETAKLLSPNSTVLHPVPASGCPMADMASAEAVAAFRREHPDAIIVAYVNTTAATKGEVDICCTSANAAKVVESLPADQEILFLPDQNLGANVMAETGRKMQLWPGYCPTHNHILPEYITAAREKYPDAVVLVHPECRPAVVARADYALSTGGMLRKVRELPQRQIIVGTEQGIIHRLKQENPDKEFLPLAPPVLCPNMKKITLESVAAALENHQFEVKLPPELLERARLPIERMLSLK